MICPICKSEFEPKRKNQVCCCKQCQDIRHIQKVREGQKRQHNKIKQERKQKQNIEYLRVHDPMALCPKEDCQYKGHLSNSNIKVCDFLFQTGLMRGMPIESCTRRKEKHKILKDDGTFILRRD